MGYGGSGYGGDLALGFGCGRVPCDCGFVVVLYEWVGDDSVCIVEW